MYQIKVYANLAAKKVGDYSRIYKGCDTLKECEEYKRAIKKYEDANTRFEIERVETPQGRR